MELGIYTFAETTPTRHRPDGQRAAAAPRPAGGDRARRPGGARRVRHRRAPPPDYVVSAPAVVLAAAAERTEADPAHERRHRAGLRRPGARVPAVRDARPALGRARGDHGRARLVHRVVPALRLRPDDYDELFAEKLDLLLKLRESERVTWSGGTARRSTTRGVYPRPVQEPLPVWIAVGGTPPRPCGPGRARAADGARDHRRQPERFAPFAELHREAARAGGARPPAAQHQLARLHRRRLAARPPTRPSRRSRDHEPDRPGARLAAADARAVRASRSLRGANFVGSPQEVIDKILFQHEIFGHQRFLMQLTVGTLPHASVLRSIELFGTEVASREAGRGAPRGR
jgi:hypothetical protein